MLYASVLDHLFSPQKEREKKKEEKKKDADKVEKHNNTKVQVMFTVNRLLVTWKTVICQRLKFLSLIWRHPWLPW